MVINVYNNKTKNNVKLFIKQLNFMPNQKGFSKIAIIMIVLILIGGAYFVFSRKDKNISFLNTENQNNLVASKTETIPSNIPENKTDNISQMGEKDTTSDWKMYRNDKYGFEFKYPLAWILRDGNKDYKPTGLNNFYQFCNKAITIPNEPLGPNDNFVERCEGEFFRVSIWKPLAEMKMIANDFAGLRLNKENKITIGDKSASEFMYSGNSEILGGVHTWHLFVIQTDNNIYSITGDSCMDDKTDCNQILSTFKFTK